MDIRSSTSEEGTSCLTDLITYLTKLPNIAARGGSPLSPLLLIVVHVVPAQGRRTEKGSAPWICGQVRPLGAALAYAVPSPAVVDAPRHPLSVLPLLVGEDERRGKENGGPEEEEDGKKRGGLPGSFHTAHQSP